jgi:hypothetical protein
MTEMAIEPFEDDSPESPFDALGVACLAWAGLFISLTIVLAVILR